MGLHQLPTTLATLVTLANRRLSSVSTSNYGRGSWNTTCNYVLIFSINFQLRCYRLLLDNLQLYARSWQWRYINRSANLQQKTIEALKRIFWPKKMLFFRLHKNPPMKMSWYYGKTRKPPKFRYPFFGGLSETKFAFCHSAKLIKKNKNVLLRARFPVRRDVYLAI